MRAVRRIVTTSIFIVPLVVVFIFGFLLVRRYYRTAEHDLVPILQAEATRILKREVRVGKVTLQGGYAYVDDVRIAEGHTLAERGAIATARQVVLDFDLRTLLLEKDRTVPLFANVRVIDPIVRLERDRVGRWNFTDLFVSHPKQNARPTVGRVQILHGTLHYSDSALPHDSQRPNLPLRSDFTGVNGQFRFYADRSVSWVATGQGRSGQLRATTVQGTYEPANRRIFVQINADHLALPLFARFLPTDTSLRSGVISGQVDLLRPPWTSGPKTPHPPPFDFQANVQVVGANVISNRFSEPITDITGAVTLSNTLSTVRLDAAFAGSALHAEGTVLGFKNPRLNGWASGSGIQFQHVLTALKLQDRFPILRQLRQVAASADVHANLQGPLNNLSVRASGPVQVTGQLTNGTAIPAAGRLQVAFSGSYHAPYVQVMGTLPQVRFRRYEAHDVQLSAVYSPKSASADFSAQIAGGRVVGRVHAEPNGRLTSYETELRARQVDLTRLPLYPTQNGAKSHGIRGIVDVDLIAQGRVDQFLPQATAEIQAANLRYGAWTAQNVRTRLQTEGEALRIEPLVVRDPKGFIIVSGRVDVRNRTLDLNAKANDVDLSRIPLSLSDQKTRTDSDSLPSPTGFAYLRDGRVTGSFDDPQLSGKLFAYGLSVNEQEEVDYAEATLSASREALVVQNGLVRRFPASATISGIVRNPLSPRAQLELNGSFQRLEMQDLAELTGSTLNVTGTAHGTLEIGGYLQHPEIAANPITVERASLDENIFDSVSAALRYDPNEAQGTWHLDNFLAKMGQTAFNGSADLTHDHHFVLSAQIANLDMGKALDQFNHSASYYADLHGIVNASASLSGILRDGAAKDLSGQILASTHGLQVNGETFGDLHGPDLSQPAVFTIQGDTILSHGFAVGTGESHLNITEFRYDLSQEALQRNDSMRVDGVLHDISLETVRHMLFNSPYVVEQQQSAAAAWVQPITNPFSGALDSDFHVGGTLSDPNVRFTWTGRDIVVGDQAIQKFTGAVAFNRKVVTLDNVQLEAGETVITATDGTLIAGQSIAGSVEMNNLPLSLLRRWFPNRPELEGLTGTVDLVSITASGTPSAPLLTASVEMKDIEWREGAPTVPAQIGPRDLRDPTRLARQLQAAKDPLSRYLHDQLSPATQKLITQYADASSAPPALQKALADDLNRLVQTSTSLYATGRFAHVTLTKETQDLIGYAPTGDALARLNRLLLEQAYPQDISGSAASVPNEGRVVRIENISIPVAVIKEGSISADDMRLALLGTPQSVQQNVPGSNGSNPVTKGKGGKGAGADSGSAPSNSGQTVSPRRYAVRASGSVEFHWQTPFIPEDPHMDLQVGIGGQDEQTPGEDLGIITALIPSPNIELNGSIKALFRWHNTLHEPVLEGSLVVKADRMHYGTMMTSVRNLDSAFTFTGNQIHVDRFTAQTQILSPRGNSVVATSEPVTMSGGLALTTNPEGAAIGVDGNSSGAPHLLISAPRLLFAETPIPGLGSGRAFGQIHTEGTDVLTISGSVVNPVISGTLYVQQSDFRMPDTLVENGSGSLLLPISPAFDRLSLVVGNNVRISASQLEAYVRTQPGKPIVLSGEWPPHLSGALTVDRGTLTFPTARFAIQRGGQVVLRFPTYALGDTSEPTLGIDVNLTATTQLQATSFTGVRKRYTITVDASGPINTGAPLDISGSNGFGGASGAMGLRLTFRTDPPDLGFSSTDLQQRITGLLGGEEAIQGLFSRNPNVGRILGTQFTDVLSASILPGLFERSGIARALGLEEFTIDTNSLNAYTLMVTGHLFGPIYLGYSNLLAGSDPTSQNGRWEFKLSYRFYDNFQFSFTTNEQRTNEYLLEGVFRF